MSEDIRILQALVLIEERNAKDYGLALWAALHEVERFYAPAFEKLKFQRFFISPSSPERSLFEHLVKGLGNVLPGTSLPSALDVLKSKEVIATSLPLIETAERFRNTIDQGKLARVVRNVTKSEDLDTHLVVVTDRAITPPPDYRYIIWDDVPDLDATIVSVATLDPQYWRNPDTGRVMTIKNRLRSAVLAITGGLLGLRECNNDECFMCEDVDSADALDFMTQLCDEHDLPKLERRTFARSTSDPTLIQQVTPVVTTAKQRP